MKKYDLAELKKILPHREPMLLIEKAELDEETSTAYAYYKVKGDEYFLQGHFPGMPIVPGVIQCEMMGQSACILVDTEGSKTPFFTGMNNVKFKDKILPGDEIKIVSKIVKQKKPFYFIEAKVYVNERLCSQGEFSFAIL